MQVIRSAATLAAFAFALTSTLAHIQFGIP